MITTNKICSKIFTTAFTYTVQLQDKKYLEYVIHKGYKEQHDYKCMIMYDNVFVRITLYFYWNSM